MKRMPRAAGVLVWALGAVALHAVVPLELSRLDHRAGCARPGHPPGVGLAVQGAPFFLGEPANKGWDTPAAAGARTVRVEVFADDPDSFIARAVAAGADGSADEIRDHQAA